MADKETKVTQKPGAVMYLSAPARNGSQFSVSWKNPLDNTESSSSSKAKAVGVEWKLTCYPSKYNRTYKWSESASATSSTLDLAAVLTGVGTHFFHPYGNAYLLSVSCTVHPWNNIGVATNKTTTTTIYAPPVPTLDPAEYDDENCHVTVGLHLPDDAPNAPVETVWWKVNVYDTQTQQTKSTEGSTDEDIVIGDNTWQSGSASAVTDIANIAQLEANINRAVKLNFMAKSRGWRKDSDQISQVVYVSRPKLPTITKVTIPSSYANDKVIVQFAMNKTTAHPVTGCRLQVFKDADSTPHTAVSDFDGTETWDDFELSDDGECSALAIGVSEVVPEVDTTTWVRVKVWNLDEARLVSHSDPYRLTKLETESPTAEDDKCYLAPLLSPVSNSILLHCYWDPNGTDDSTGTEITWSDDAYAWLSTRQPNSFQTEIDQGAASVIREGDLNPTSYHGHVDFYIGDLEVGTKYWVKCRRYLEGENKTTYGKWSEKRSIIVGVPPTAASLSAPAQIATGKGIPCEFTITAEDEVVARTRWSLYLDPKVNRLDGSGTAITGIIGKSGTGGTMGTIPWSKVLSAIKESGRDSVAIMLDAGFNGAHVMSDTTRVYIIDPPKCKVITHTVTEQPATFDVRFSAKTVVNLRCVVTSQGVDGNDAVGQHDQEPGDCVWSTLIEEPRVLDNTASDSASYPSYVTVTMPEGIDLRDGGKYTVTVSAETDMYGGKGLRGGNATGTFSVVWGHQATYPGLAKITPRDTVDTSGNRRRWATIGLVKPSYNLLEFFYHGIDANYWVANSALSAAGDMAWGWYRFTGTYSSNLVMSVKKSATFISGSTYVIKPSTKYTFVCQVDNSTVTGTVKLRCVGGTSSVWSESVDATITGDGVYRVVATTKSSITSSTITSVGFAFDASNGSFKGQVRLSLVEGGNYVGGVRAPSTPEGRSTDVYDVYRVTPDGVTPVVVGAKTDSSVIDEYAPYGGGERAYRIVMRTKDGDLTYRDVAYRFAGGDIRIDFDGTYVELPYDVSLSDTFSKDFESRAHFGQRTPSGYWNESVARTSTLSTRLIKIRNRDLEARVRRLAQYDGPCFLRLPNGCAYEADVQVSGISEDEMGNAGISISIDATEVMPSGTYSVVTEDN